MKFSVTDLSSDGFGQPWGHTRRYRNKMSAVVDYGNGYNWQVEQWPYATTNGTTVLMVRTEGSLWFSPDGGGFVGRYGVREQMSFNGTAGTYSVLFPDGSTEEYFDFSAGVTAGFLSRRTSASGDTTTLNYDPTSGLLQSVERFNAALDVTEQYLYEYGSGDDAARIVSATIRRQTGSDPWIDVERAAYTYYQVDDDNGMPGDLRTAVLQRPDGGGGWSDVGVHYYRYYLEDDPLGFAHGLKFALSPQSFANLARDFGDPFAVSDGELAPYADFYFEYDGAMRVSMESVAGGSQTYGYTYTESGFTEEPRNWIVRTVETRPDGTSRIVYTNHIQQLLLSDLQGGTQDDRWFEYQILDDHYQVEQSVTSSAIDVPTSGNPYNDTVPDLAVSLKSNDGLIYANTFNSDKLPTDEKVRPGEFGGSTQIRTYSYSSRTDSAGNTIHPLATKRDFSTLIQLTQYTFTYHGSTLQPLQRTTQLPTVAGGQNGSNTATFQREIYDLYNQMIWEQGPNGYIDNFTYDPVTGARTQWIRDVNPASITLPSGWSRPSGLPAPLNLITDVEVDDLGRPLRTLAPVHSDYADDLRTVEWNVYFDAEHKTYSARGYATDPYDAAASTLVNPVTITQNNANGQVVDLIQAVRASTEGPLEPTDEFLQPSWVAWTHHIYNLSGMLIAERVYHTIPVEGEGLPGENYDETIYGYDAMGRLNRIVNPVGTIQRTVFDPLGRQLGVWVGTDDTGATDSDPTNGGADGNNMLPISARTYRANYDFPTPATTTDYVDASSSHDRTTTYTYDFRNRLIETTGPENYFESRLYNNLDYVIRIERRVGSSSGDGIDFMQFQYDSRSQVYSSFVGGGTFAAALVQRNWYDEAGNLIKQIPYGAKDQRAATKMQYDGNARMIGRYAVVRISGTDSYAEAVAVTNNDYVFEQTEFAYDVDGSRSALETTTYRRFPGSTAVNKLTTSDARRTRTAQWFDGVGRPVAAADYGTANTTRPTSPPASSDAVPVTTTGYDDAGNLLEMVDPLGRVARRKFDARGRTIATIDNFLAEPCGCAGNDVNVTVRLSYTPDNQRAALTAENPATGPQTTTYEYGVSPADGSTLTSNSLLRAVIYPDAEDADDRMAYSYNRQQQVLAMRDQNGTVHEYVYDGLGRLTDDLVTTLASGIDGTVRRLATVYDAKGRIDTHSSYAATSGGSPLNQVQFTYDNDNLPTSQWQSHSGAVGGSTPRVQYAYQGGSLNTRRLLSLTYPDGRVLNSSYGASGSDDDRLSRVYQLIDGSTARTQYTYYGVNRAIKADYLEPGIRWDLSPTGNSFDGLDSLDRVVDCLWHKYSTPTGDPARIEYTYDRASNRTSRTVVGVSGNDELYRYDPLNRLTDLDRGTLSSEKNRITAPTLIEGWRLDATGNWRRYELFDFTTPTNSLDQDRTQNTSNEITAFTTAVGPIWADPGYDRAGNTTAFPQPLTPADGYMATYDAWNRLVKLEDSSSTVETYAYDALDRRTTRTVGGATQHFYYSREWQVLEERLNSSTSAERQHIWGKRYVDDLVFRDRDTDGNGTLDERLYALQDANWNVVAVTNPAGVVQERYRYKAYGAPQFLEPDFTPKVSSDLGWETLYSGYQYNPFIGLYSARLRMLDPFMGRWLTRDPIGYLDSTLNLFGYVAGHPVQGTDPTGLFGIISSLYAELQDLYLYPRYVYSFDDYVKVFSQMNPHLNDQQLGWSKWSFRKGCCGITHAHLGKIPTSDMCYKTLELALKHRQNCKCQKGSARIFSIHLKNNLGWDGSTPDAKVDSNGKVDLSNWNFDNDPKKVVYDFGWLEEGLFPVVVSATGAHNPGQRYFPDKPAQEMRVIINSMRNWNRGAPAYYGYTDFNFEVWCIACSDGEYNPGIVENAWPIFPPNPPNIPYELPKPSRR